MTGPLFGNSRFLVKLGLFCLLSLCFGLTGIGCGDSGRQGPTDPVTYKHLQNVVEMYQQYAEAKKRTPPNETALKEFIQALPAEKKQRLADGGDMDKLFVSPRDGKPYEIRYNYTRFNRMTGQPIAWEQQGVNGSRYVGLAMGYVEEYTDERFDELKKRHP